jgi:hypothetical protein
MEAKEVRVRYDDVGDPAAGAEFRLRLPVDGIRSGVGFSGEVARPGVVRDALLVLGEVLASDLRFKARDRSDYLAYLLQQGKKASDELWNAQKAYLDARYGEATRRESPLDPILTVSDDGVAIEVFSADESSYARLFLRNEAFATGDRRAQVDRTIGTTHVDFSEQLIGALSRMRSYRRTTIVLEPPARGEDRELLVPYRWIRAFGQVQSASTLPHEEIQIAPVDLYNVLLVLRRQKAKTSPRALRYELIPGEVPRIVLEPWDLVLPGTGGPFRGGRPQVVRTWGRKRLMVLARLLPHAKSVTVRLIGAGLPTYYVIDAGDATLTLSLSGWTDSGWAGISTFDLLSAEGSDELLARQLGERLGKGPTSLDDLVASTGRPKNDVRKALLYEMQRGLVLHDIASSTFRSRPLFADPVDADRLRYRDEREADAHRLLAGDDQVRILRVHDLGGQGVRIEGEIEDKKAHRTYQTSFTLDREGQTIDAACTSPQFRRSGLREGPTVPMIALRLLYARQQAELEKARGTEEGRKLIRAETRTLIRRAASGPATTYRLSLDDRQVVVRWAAPEEVEGKVDPTRLDGRMHRIYFGSADEARAEYFARLDRLAKKGFIDASAAEAV